MTITLSPYGDMAPVPRVEISIGVADVPAGTDRVTFWRSSQGSEMKVRGGVDRIMVSTISVVDLEPPRGAMSTYEAECWDGAVPLGRVAVGSATVPWIGESTTVLVQQPLDPRLSVEVSSLRGSWPSLTQEAPGEEVLAEGESLPSFVGFGPMGGFRGVELDLGVATREDAARLRATLGTKAEPQLPVWLIRGGDTFLPRVFFCRVSSIVEVDINNRVGREWSRFRATVNEIQPPAQALVVALLSYDDLDVSYASYTAMDTAYPSYDARDRDYSLAGAAG